MSDPFWNHLEEAVSQATGQPFDGRPAHGPGGGCINRAWQLAEPGGRQFFVKTNDPSLAAMFAVEAAGLEAIAATGTIRTPHAICHGSYGNHSYLILEWLNMGRGSQWELMGRQLAALHQADCGDQFGWEQDNYIGATPQKNKVSHSWIDFYGQQRLGFQAELARRNDGRLPRMEELIDKLSLLLAGHQVEPALLHGDLWSGNAAFTTSGEPVIFDVAVYRGDPEADLAMTELFGGFPPQFYKGYQEIRSVDDGYPRRRTLYNLYHIINHYNLFGGHYLHQANQMIDELLASI